MVNLKKLEKLSPEEKIKRLHELQKRRKEEIESAQRLIIESEEQLQKQKEIEKMIRGVPLPEQKKVEIKDIWKGETLEEQIKKEKIPELTKEQRQYGHHLAETAPIDEITKNVYSMEKDIANKGYMNQTEQERLQANMYALHKKEEDYKKRGMEYEAKKAMHAQEEADRFLNTYKMAG